MPEGNTAVTGKRAIRLRHRGRLAQVRIYLGKMLRMFIYESDWKVLPMSALIAALVAMVVRNQFFLNMEGDLMGAFALTCVAIWNGCFNSIQAVCRERPIIKREHRSGMHISSYIAAHMIYQAMLCLAQAVLTVVVCSYMGVQFPKEGFFTDLLIVDIGISIFLISYASDMLSLLISSLAHTTTTAMTVMPFVLIFQLVFSGGIFSLPAWSEPLSELTISNYGLKVIAAQADYNHAPMATAWNTLEKLRSKEISGSFSVGQILDILSSSDHELVRTIRSQKIHAETTVGELWSEISSKETYRQLTETPVDLSALVEQMKAGNMSSSSGAENEHMMTDLLIAISERYLSSRETPPTVGELLDLLQVESVIEALKDQPIGKETTIGELVDWIASNPDIQPYREKSANVSVTVGWLMELIGEDRVREMVEQQTASVSRVAAYDKTVENIASYWASLIFFTMIYALLAMISLEFIDRDRR